MAAEGGADGSAKSSEAGTVGTAGRLVLATRGLCPFTMRVMLALTVKGAEFDVVSVGAVGSDGLPRWFKEASVDDVCPAFCVRSADGVPEPVLEGDARSDSLAMVRWVDRNVPGGPPLVPPGQEEAVEEVAAWVNKEFFKSFSRVMIAPKPPIQAEFRPKLSANLRRLDEELKANAAAAGGRKGPYFLGDGSEVSLADILLTPFVVRIPLLEYFRDYTVDPTLTDAVAYIEAMYSEFPANRAVGFSRDALKTFYKAVTKKQGPLSATRLQHEAMRACLKKLVEDSAALAASPDDDAAAVALNEFWLVYHKFIWAHSVMEDEIVYKVLESMSPGVTDRFSGEHEHEIPELDNIDRLVAGMAATAAGSEARAAATAAVAARMVSVSEEHDAHFKGEEKTLFPFVQEIPAEQHCPLFKKALSSCQVNAGPPVTTVILNILPASRAQQYVHNFINVWQKTGDQDLMDYMLKVLVTTSESGALRKERFEDLLERLPPLGPALEEYRSRTASTA